MKAIVMSPGADEIVQEAGLVNALASETADHDSAAYETEEPADITLLRPSATGYDLTLRVVPLAQVVPHEHYHAQRVTELAARLAAEGMLINPPIVAQQGDKYVVLDGATRLTAMRQLGYPAIIVQVVNLVRQGVQLTSWHHVVYGGSEAALLAVLRAVPGLRLAAADRAMVNEMIHQQKFPKGALAYWLTPGNESYVLSVEDGTSVRGDGQWLQVLHDVVEAYGQWGNVERTLSRDVPTLASQFLQLAALVVFPRFAPEMLLTLAAAGQTVPAGITRFVIPGRILRLNAPLERLAADEPLSAKQAWLDALIGEKLRGRQVRYYEEPVVLLDE